MWWRVSKKTKQAQQESPVHTLTSARDEDEIGEAGVGVRTLWVR